MADVRSTSRLDDYVSERCIELSKDSNLSDAKNFSSVADQFKTIAERTTKHVAEGKLPNLQIDHDSERCSGAYAKTREDEHAKSALHTKDADKANTHRSHPKDVEPSAKTAPGPRKEKQATEPFPSDMPEAMKISEQGELNFQEHLPRWYPIDPGAPTHFFPSDVAPRILIPGRE